MAVETTEQIVREAPEIEAYKLGLLADAKKLADLEVDLPVQQIAGMTDLQKRAIIQAQEGIGAFQPFLDRGAATMGQAAPMIQQAISSSQGTTSQSIEDMMRAAQGARGIAGTGASSLRGISGEIPGMISGLGTQLGTATAGGLTASQQAAMQAQQAIDAARGTVGTAARDLGTAGQFGRSAAEMGIAGLMGTGAEFDPGSIQGFMSPFEEAAVQQALSDIRRQGDIAQQSIGAQAVGAGAFGGSRQAVAEQELQRNILDQQARTAAQLRAQGFESAANRAQQTFEQARARQLQAAGLTGQLGQAGAGTALQAAQAAGQLGLSAEQLAAQTGLQTGQLGLSAQQQAAANAATLAQTGLQGAQQRGALEQEAARLGISAEELAGRLAQQSGALGQSQAQLGLQAGDQLSTLGLREASLGQLQQQLAQQQQESLFNFGQQQQQQDQAVLEAQRQSDLAQLYEPYQRVSFLSDIYRGAPSTQQSISASTAPNVSAAQQFLGTGIAGLSAAAGAERAGLFG